MKTISSKMMKDGKLRVIVEIARNESIMGIIDGGYYRLGYPVYEVIASHIIENMEGVFWCSATQKWMD